MYTGGDKIKRRKMRIKNNQAEYRHQEKGSVRSPGSVIGGPETERREAGSV